jgi:hypothetical protein
MGFTNFLETTLLDEVFGATNYIPPATLFVGLSTSTVTEAGVVTEPIGNGYTRVSVTNNSTNWPAATAADPSTKSNGTAITFPTATGSWGTVVDFFIADALTLGNILAYGTLTSSQAINTNDTASFAIGDLDITLE